MKFTAYHKIPQFKDVIKNIQHTTNYNGLDEEGNPIYVKRTLPTITFKGTVKLHGTNAQLCYDGNTLQGGKRSSLLLDNTDTHFGFKEWINANKKYLLSIIKPIHEKYNSKQTVIYGEWAGNTIQKGVAISQLSKAFYMFDITVDGVWIDITNIKVEAPVYNLHHFKTYEIDIDFNNPDKAVNELIKLTTEVEKECPVSKELGVKGTGEGIVWTAYYNDKKLIFKVKGEKHSSTKTKKLVEIDEAKLNSIKEFVNYACTENRIEQAITEVNATELSHIPNILKWIANDIMTEEINALNANNLEWKEVVKYVSTKARNYYIEKLNKIK